MGGKYSLHTLAMLFPPQSTQRVYFHGVWQRSRNRQPSLVLGNQSNPREAFETAKVLVGDYLEKIRSFPYSRQGIWSEELIEAIMDNRPIEEIKEEFF
jgi:hypothetical protein